MAILSYSSLFLPPLLLLPPPLAHCLPSAYPAHPPTTVSLCFNRNTHAEQALTDRQAYATRQDFAQQQTMLARIDQRMGGVLSQMPGINSLITMIHSRRRRDSVIMGVVVGICVILILGYLFGF